MQTAHRDIVSRMQENFEQKMEGLRNNVDSAHGEQVQELQSLLEDRHKMVSGLYWYMYFCLKLKTIIIMKMCQHQIDHTSGFHPQSEK